MPIPKAVARANRRFTNRLMIRLAGRPPFAALVHRGRRSGRRYRIPINAFPCGDGFVIALTYGADADWVRNVLAAGGCVLEYGGESVELRGPRLVRRDEVWTCISATFRVALIALRIHEFLLLEREP